MESSKLIQVLKTFSAKEMRRLSEFMSSPYFNKNERIIAFFSYIEKQHPAFASEKLEKEKVFAKLFPKEKFDDVKVRGLLSETLKLTEEFLAAENMKKQGLSMNSFLLNELNARRIHSLFYIRKKEFAEEKGLPVQDKWHFINAYLLAAEEMDHWINHADFNEESLLSDDPFQKTQDRLVQLFLYENLIIAATSDTFKDIISYKGMDPELRGHIAALLSSRKTLPEVFGQLRLFPLLTQGHQEKDYQALKEQILGQLPARLSRKDLKLGLELLHHFTVIQQIKGNINYMEDGFAITRKFQELRLHIENGEVGEIFFTNAVIDALKQQEYKWALDFIDRNAPYLPSKIREATVAFCKANAYEKQGKYTEALGHLGPINISSVVANINIRILQVKIYYGKKDMDQVVKTCASFLKFLKSSNKLSENKTAPLINFAETASQLARLSSGKAKTDLQALITRIENDKELSLKAWLAEKAKELL